MTKEDLIHDYVEAVIEEMNMKEVVRSLFALYVEKLNNTEFDDVLHMIQANYPELAAEYEAEP